MHALTVKVIAVILLTAAAVAGILLALKFQPRAEFTSPPLSEQTRTFHYPMNFVKRMQHDPHAGEKVYREYCASCHAPKAIIPVNAPKIGEKKAWRAFSNMSQQQLFELAANGVGAMPARGGCFECDDALLKKAITFLTTFN